MKKQVHEAVIELLEKNGVPCELEKTSKHNKVRFLVNGQARMHVCTRSPSDRRTELNALADVRRVLKQAGMDVVQ